MTEQQLLRDIGGEQEPPICYKDRQVGPITVLSKGEIYPGYVGQVVTRERYGFVGFRMHEKHYHVNEAAYMLSKKVLDRLAELGVELVLIAEDDTGKVYEWHRTHFDTEVSQSAKGEAEKHEEQYQAKIDEAWGVYENHTVEVLIGEREVN